MDEKGLLSRIERNPSIMFGKPVIKGTRLPVDIILEKLAYGYTEEKLKAEYPFITGDMGMFNWVPACLTEVRR
jgi:uncharacterized protein (DUF433 family)